MKFISHKSHFCSTSLPKTQDIITNTSISSSQIKSINFKETETSLRQKKQNVSDIDHPTILIRNSHEGGSRRGTEGTSYDNREKQNSFSRDKGYLELTECHCIRTFSRRDEKYKLRFGVGILDNIPIEIQNQTPKSNKFSYVPQKLNEICKQKKVVKSSEVNKKDKELFKYRLTQLIERQQEQLQPGEEKEIIDKELSIQKMRNKEFQEMKKKQKQRPPKVRGLSQMFERTQKRLSSICEEEKLIIQQSVTQDTESQSNYNVPFSQKNSPAESKKNEKNEHFLMFNPSRGRNLRASTTNQSFYVKELNLSDNFITPRNKSSSTIHQNFNFIPLPPIKRSSYKQTMFSEGSIQRNYTSVQMIDIQDDNNNHNNNITNPLAQKRDQSYERPRTKEQIFKKCNIVLNFNQKHQEKMTKEEKELEIGLVNSWKVDKNGELYVTEKGKGEPKREFFSLMRTQRLIASLKIILLDFLRKCDKLNVNPKDAIEGNYFKREPFSRVGSFLLFMSINDKEEQIAKELLMKDKLLIFERDEKLQNPLHAAIQNGLKKLSIWLIHNGADFEQRDVANRSPLYYSLTRGMFDISKYILFRRACPWAISGDYKYESLSNNKQIILCIEQSKQADICWRLSKKGTLKQLWQKNRCFLYSDESCKVNGDMDCLTDKEIEEVKNYQLKNMNKVVKK